MMYYISDELRSATSTLAAATPEMTYGKKIKRRKISLKEMTWMDV